MRAGPGRRHDRPHHELACRAGQGVAVLLKIYAYCIDAMPPPPTSASPTRSAPKTPSQTRVTRVMATPSRPPEMPGQSRDSGGSGQRNRSHWPRPWIVPPRPWPVPASSVVRPVLVRGPFRLRPWARTAQESGAHGRIAGGGTPESHLERRKCRSAGVTQAERTGCKTVGSAYDGSNPSPATSPHTAARVLRGRRWRCGRGAAWSGLRSPTAAVPGCRGCARPQGMGRAVGGWRWWRGWLRGEGGGGVAGGR